MNSWTHMHGWNFVVPYGLYALICVMHTGYFGSLSLMAL